MISAITRYFASWNPIKSTSVKEKVERVVLDAIAKSPQFNGYKVNGTPITALNVRPANLFYRALLGANPVTEPGSRQFLAFLRPHYQIRAQVATAPANEVVAFSANGVPAAVCDPRTGQPTQAVPNLATFFGTGVYQISYGEIRSLLESQKIYISEPFPLPFYYALKQAMLHDGIVTLPYDGSTPTKVRELAQMGQFYNTSSLIQDVERNFVKYGFSSLSHCQDVLNLTLYQLGALVVKSENYHVFLDDQGKIINRQTGTPDAIRLINLCGIRGIKHKNASAISKFEILKHAFKTSLIAAEKEFVIFPAVGMGVWGGDPETYWNAFLSAVAETNVPLEKIFINPGHQPTRFGKYQGCKGEEFGSLLRQYQTKYANDPKALANLGKIVNLFDRRTDLMQFARILKKEFPQKSVSLVNASDPDVTLGNCVGQLVNNIDCGSTTEENYTAIGTNGLCGETITGVHEDLSRLIAVQ